jgi:NADH-quinone oxidoreductase subunit N
MMDQIRYIAPEISLLCFALIVIVLDLFIKPKRVLPVIAIAGSLVALLAVLLLFAAPATDVFNKMIAIDQFGLFFKALILVSLALVILASHSYVLKFERFQGEFYALLMLSAIGLMLLVSAINLITIYVALELSSISLYVLVSFLKDKKSRSRPQIPDTGRNRLRGTIYGMALIFGTTGNTCRLYRRVYEGMPAAGQPAPRSTDRAGSVDNRVRL